ncbi:MAG: hypothetical protein IJE78_05035 [Bacteroidaceae bacterium]|nr:hypothetical protein [Bacteroidaceae bacterium]
MTVQYFHKHILKVKPETPLLRVMVALSCVGVIIEGRYTIEATSDGTLITYLATNIQQRIINMFLDYIKRTESKERKDT